MPTTTDDPEVRDDILAEGEASLYFVEALAMKLIDNGVLDLDEVIEALEIAASTKQTAADEGQTPKLSRQAAVILSEVANSISAMRKSNRTVKS